MESLRKIIKYYIPEDIELISIDIDSKASFIKVIIDSINDISIEKTAVLARKIKNDESLISNFPKGLKLEVGTPGIGSNLEKKFQYIKNIGRKIQLKYRLNSNIISKTYTLLDANEFGIIVKDGNNKHNVDYSHIISASVNISFD